MSEAVPEHELLALIEGELEPAEVRRVRQALADRPELLARVDRLASDRAVLRGVPEPSMSRDFLGDLEPWLVRPVLVEEAPGAYRRARRRRTQARRIQLAVAAVLAVAVTAGILAVASGLLRRLPGSPGGEPGSMVASTDDGGDIACVDAGSPRSALPAGQQATPPVAGSDDELPHRPPAIGAERRLVRDQDVAPTRTADRPTGDPVVLPIALCLGADEAILADLLGAMDAPVTLVRNFSFDEAAELERQWLAHRAASQGESPVASQLADLTDGNGRRQRLLHELARRVNAETGRSVRTRQATVAAGTDRPSSGVVSGDAARSPSLEQQLQCSSRGAAHTITVSLADLPALLAAMHRQESLSARLAALPPDATSIADQDALASWVDTHAAARQALDEIQATDTDALVVLPVVMGR
jgi:anti-sigma factor RsiW